MARPLTATIMSSLDILNQSLGNETLQKIEAILLQDSVEFKLTPHLMVPLTPYIRAECDWCFSNTTTVNDLLLERLRSGLLIDVPQLLSDVAVLTNELNDTYLNNGAFLRPSQDR